jgi:hypothetical protein
MKYLQFNLENFGGYDVEFPMRKSEFLARVDGANDLLKLDARKFNKELKWAFSYVQANIHNFSSTDQCEGPLWDYFREELVDSICKSFALDYCEKEQVVG